MKLRTKSHLAIAVPLLVATVMLILLVRYLEFKSCRKIDEQMARRSMGRLQDLLQMELEVGAKLLAQSARSKLIANAVVEGDRAVLNSRFGSSFLNQQRWDLCVLWAQDGLLLFSKIKREDLSSDVSESVLQQLERLPGVQSGMGPADVRSFFGVVEGNLYMLRYASVIGHAEEGAIAGLLLVGQQILEEDSRRISQLSGLNFEVSVIDAAERDRLTQMEAVNIRERNGVRVCEGYLLDWTGQRCATITLQVEDWAVNLRQSLGSMDIAGVVIGAILLFLLLDRLIWQMVAKRLTRLSQAMVAIQRKSDYSKRLPVDGNDEVAILAKETNQMLARVQSSQEILERVNSEMQQRVAERTLALHEANLALEADITARIKVEKEQESLRAQLLRAQKMEAVGTLAGGIAHDFNNILTGIMGYAQLLQSDLTPDNPSNHSIKQVIAAAERASGLVKQILTFSRQTPGEKSTVSMHRVLSEAFVLLKAGLPSNIQATLKGITRGESVKADATQIHQVLMNLGTNAGHAMKAGGTLEIEISRVAGPLRRPDGQLMPNDVIKLSVKDTGDGIPQDVLPRIFDPFFSTKPVNEGTGLGLAVVHGIVADHGGWLEVHSEVGKGTRFDLFFPALAIHVEDHSRTSPPIMVRGEARIMLVDDEALVLGVMEKNLKRLGYKVTAECDPIAAIGKFEKTPTAWDLVISDYMMPGLNGLQLHAAMRKLNPAQAVILMTGYSPDVSGRMPEEFGLARIVEKPLNMVQFSYLVSEVIAERLQTKG